MFMKRAFIGTATFLLISVQAFGTVALCLLPCCAPMPTIAQCSAHEQTPVTMHHAGHHHMGTFPARVSGIALKLSSVPACGANHSSVVASIPKQRTNVTRVVLPTAVEASVLELKRTIAPVNGALDTSPPVSPNRTILRI
jgi:hypothetical protein